MQFKFRSKPYSTNYLTIIPFDQQYCNENTEIFLKETYGMVFNPKDGIRNKYEVYKSFTDDRVQQIILIDLTGKFNHQAILQLMLDVSVAGDRWLPVLPDGLPAA